MKDSDPPDLFALAAQQRLRDAGWREDEGTVGLAWQFWWTPDGVEKVPEAEAIARLDREEKV